MNRTVVRLGAATLASAVLLTPVAASAHITVSSPDAAREGFGKVVVRVPNESDTASTTKVRLTLPADQPLAYVSVQPKTGWTVDVQKAKLDQPVMAGDARISEAVRTVTWSTRGDGIKPGEFDEFALSGGPLPDAKAMTFDAQQTYSDGEVVDWNEVQKGDTEPEHPAPVLSLAAATTDDADTASATVEQASASSDDGPDVLGRVLGVVAVVLAAAALLVSSGGRVRDLRRAMLAVAALVLTVLAAGAGPASAHAALLGTNPKDGASVATAPAELTIEFSEAIGRPAVVVTGPDGRRVSGKPSSLDRTVTVPLNSADERGEYRMVYRVVSVDGHPVSGDSTFTTTTGAEPSRTVAAPVETDDRSFVHRHAEHIVWIGLAAVVGIALIVAPLLRRRRTA